DEVVDQPGRSYALWRGKQILNPHRDRIETRNRYAIVRELIAHLLPVHGAHGIWIVDHAFEHRAPKRIAAHASIRNRGRKVPGFVGRRRNSLLLVVDLLVFAELLPVPEEERLIAAIPKLGNPYGTADRVSIVVAPLNLARVVARAIVRIRIAGVEEF